MAKRRTYSEPEIYSKKRYNQKTLIREREYGFYWYSWIWHLARPVLIFLCAMVVVVGLAANGWFYVYDHMLKPVNPQDSDTVTFKIAQGDSISTIASNLVEQHLLRSETLFKYSIMFNGLTSLIHYGDYQISPNMDANQIISLLTSGSDTAERTITIIPGWTVTDIAAYFVKIGALPNANEFLQLCNDSLTFKNYYTIQQAAENRGLAGRKYVLEGYLAPDTYRVFTNASAESLIHTLMDQTDVVINTVFNADDSAGKYQTTLTQDQTIILASMIEKEAKAKGDFAKVSAVFHNRLAAGMRLESDPTVKYVLGVQNYILTPEQLATDSPYNTYVVAGLPVGPICNPSQAAIEAALYPDLTYIDEKYLYFCSKGPEASDLQFSKTLAEHNAAVAQYRPLWEAYDAKLAANATPAPSAP